MRSEGLVMSEEALDRLIGALQAYADSNMRLASSVELLVSVLAEDAGMGEEVQRTYMDGSPR